MAQRFRTWASREGQTLRSTKETLGKVKTSPGFGEELSFREQGYRFIAGVDEVGRGPLAGPVMASAVILPDNWLKRSRRKYVSRKISDPRDLLNDSKKLTANQRELLYDLILETALSWHVGRSSADYIDRVGIVPATRKAMCDAVDGLVPQADALLVDAVDLTEPGLVMKAVIGGDSICGSIAAASIVAKVTRDRFMDEMHERYPGYGFDHNRGYPTPGHLASLRKLGPCEIHRRRFEPLRTYLLQPNLL